jgi:hypothetical protein
LQEIYNCPPFFHLSKGFAKLRAKQTSKGFCNSILIVYGSNSGCLALSFAKPFQRWKKVEKWV